MFVILPGVPVDSGMYALYANTLCCSIVNASSSYGNCGGLCTGGSRDGQGNSTGGSCGGSSGGGCVIVVVVV